MTLLKRILRHSVSPFQILLLGITVWWIFFAHTQQSYSLLPGFAYARKWMIALTCYPIVSVLISALRVLLLQAVRYEKRTKLSLLLFLFAIYDLVVSVFIIRAENLDPSGKILLILIPVAQIGFILLRSIQFVFFLHNCFRKRE